MVKHVMKLGKLISLVFAVTLLFTFCKPDSKTPNSKEPKVESETINAPDFNSQKAYQFIQKQVDFGPRVPGSEAHVLCKDWKVAQLDSLNA